jgi:hypothetical protein
MTDPAEQLRPLLRTRQIRELTGLRPDSPAGKARLPRADVVFSERWPEGSI